jgi:hypothetical protein
MTKIYLIWTCESAHGDDWRVEAAFSRKELAQECLRVEFEKDHSTEDGRLITAGLFPMELDVWVEKHARDMSLYHVAMTRNGRRIFVRERQDFDSGRNRFHTRYGDIRGHVWAVSQQHALAIVDDWRYMLIENGAWAMGLEWEDKT